MAQQRQPSKSSNNNVRDRVATDGKVVVAESYEAPLPHPQILEQYDRIVPGSAQAIIDDFKENAELLRNLQKRQLEAAISRDTKGQWMAFVLAIFVIALSGYSLYLGHVWVAGGSIIIALVSLAIAFLKKY